MRFWEETLSKPDDETVDREPTIDADGATAIVVAKPMPASSKDQNMKSVHIEILQNFAD